MLRAPSRLGFLTCKIALSRGGFDEGLLTGVLQFTVRTLAG
jgi:hypothetical protein